MILLRLLNPQGLAGLAAATILALLLVVAKIDARHWKNQSVQFEQLYRAETKAHAETIANFKVATERARAADRANADRVAVAQSSISERINHDFEARLADARARADRLRQRAQAASDHGRVRGAPVPGLPAATARSGEAAGQDRLPDADRLIATEQAIQLDALIRWVRAQAAIDPTGPVSD